MGILDVRLRISESDWILEDKRLLRSSGNLAACGLLSINRHQSQSCIFQSLIVLSSLREANRFPSGLKATLRMLPA